MRRNRRIVAGVAFVLGVALYGVAGAGGEWRIYIPSAEQQSSENVAPSGLVTETTRQAKALRKDASPGEVFALIETKIQEAQGEEKGDLKRLEAYLKLNEKDYLGAAADFNMIARGDVPASGKTYAEARLRLAYIKLHNGEKDAALEEFGNLATGVVQCDPATATDAALRTGALLRLTLRADEAMDVYQQIADQAPKRSDALYALLQKSGLEWESGKGDYGHPAETSAEFFAKSMGTAQQVFSDPAAPPETAATAELIYLEDFYFLGDYEKAAGLAETYVDKWLAYYAANPPKGSAWNPARQICAAQTWLAFCLYRIGDYEECIETCRLVRSGAWKAEDPYKNFNVFGYSMIYEAFAQEALGNTDEGTRLRQQAQEEYPSWYNAVIESVENKLGLRNGA